MKYTVTGRKKVTLPVEGTSPNDAIARFVGVTGGAEPEIVNGMDVLGKCEGCHKWCIAPDGEYYGDDRDLLCSECYWETVRATPTPIPLGFPDVPEPEDSNDLHGEYDYDPETGKDLPDDD